MSKKVATLERISKTYGKDDLTVKALDSINLEIYKGDYLAVMGASGSGKSTAMNIIGCLDRPSEGVYKLNGIPVEKQRVEILKVLFRGAKILILDEPTAVLVPQEVDELFKNLKELQKNGVTIIFISHKLDEVLKIADQITVMRGGEIVGTVDSEGIDKKDLAEMMIGKT